MNNEILSVVYLLLVLVLVLPGFFYANKNKKVFFKNLMIWIGIAALIVILFNLFNN
jgi:hypothetical protein